MPNLKLIAGNQIDKIVTDSLSDVVSFLKTHPILDDVYVGCTDGVDSFPFNCFSSDCDVYDFVAWLYDFVKRFNAIDNNGVIIDNPDDLGMYLTFFDHLGYKESHTSLSRGYVSRKKFGKIATYSGRFGYGFVLYTPTRKSTQFCPITYFVKED